MRIAILTIASILTASSALAGPLSPPAGPVAPTGRFGPRIEVNDQNTPGDADSVFKITQPGSYYLAGNVNGEAFKHGIEIASSFVTLDLNGFWLNGVVDSLDGIATTNAIPTSITIRNGFLDNWVGAAINASNSIDVRLENIDVNFGLGDGIVVNQWATVLNCSAQFVEDGFVTGDSSTLVGCRASSCRADGFNLGNGCQVLHCRADSNTGRGIRALVGSVIVGCVASGNGADGISALGRAVVESCEAELNGDDGIDVGTRCSIHGCVAVQNSADGISASSGSVIATCTADSNGADGIHADEGSIIRDCVSKSNAGWGIFGPGVGLVVGCAATNNGGHGIVASSFTTVKNCLAARNGMNVADGAGIYQRVAAEARCHIEGNTCIDNDHGIVTEGTRNLIIRNVASGNSVADFGPIPPNNAIGFIHTFQGVSVVSDNPFANIRY